MALPDYTFIEGFDKYTLNGTNRMNFSTATSMLPVVLGEWTSCTRDSTAGSMGFDPPLAGAGASWRQAPGNSTSHTLLKTLGVNLARIIGGVTWQLDGFPGTSSVAAIVFYDSSSAQLTIGFNVLGQVVVRLGGTSGTVLATSTLSYSFGTPIFVEWDFTFNNSSGSLKVYFNGVLDPAMSLSGIDTCGGTANNYVNRMGVLAANNGNHTIDNLYIWGYTAAGGSETPALTNPIVQTSWAESSVSTAFTIVGDTLGDPVASPYTLSTNASPGANQLVLRRFTCEASGNLNSIGVNFNTTSAGALLKAVIYADNVGGTAPAALIAVGTEVTGTTADTANTLPFSSAVPITSGTSYWIGYITNTSLNVYAVTNATTAGFRAANTYTSGAPATAPTMTSGQISYAIWGNLTGTTDNAAAVSHTMYGGTANYVQSATVGAEDLYDFSDLTSSPSAIYTVAVKALVNKTDTGVRTLNLRAKSGAVTSSGSSPNQALLTTDYFYSSYFNTDPNTGLAWTPTDVDLASFGYQINS